MYRKLNLNAIFLQCVGCFRLTIPASLSLRRYSLRSSRRESVVEQTLTEEKPEMADATDTSAPEAVVPVTELASPTMWSKVEPELRGSDAGDVEMKRPSERPKRRLTAGRR